MAEHQVALHRARGGPRCEAAMAELRQRLGAAAVEQPDPTSGFFAVTVAADSHDDAVMRVRNAIADTGADECFELGESSGHVPR